MMDGPLLVAAPPDPMLGQLVAGRFRVLARIGHGGMGVIYRARQEPVDREVALKVLSRELTADPEAVRRFFHEAKIVSRLGHRAVVHLYDFGRTEDGLLFMAMELIRGQTLRQALENGPLEPARAVAIVEQVCDALVEAHAVEVIHRDLKPENIMLEVQPDRPEQVRVLDFGLAKLGDVSAITRSGAVFGTPTYMSPEQCRGDAVIDGRADLYALGVVLFELLAGRPPFVASTSVGLVFHHLSSRPPTVSESRPGLPVLAGLERLVASLLAKDPAGRPQDARAARAALASVRRELAPREAAADRSPLPLPRLNAPVDLAHAPTLDERGPPSSGAVAPPSAAVVSPPPVTAARASTPSLLSGQLGSSGLGASTPPTTRPRTARVLAAALVLVTVAGASWWVGSRGTREAASPSPEPVRIAAGAPSPSAPSSAPPTEAVVPAVPVVASAAVEKMPPPGPPSTGAIDGTMQEPMRVAEPQSAAPSPVQVPSVSRPRPADGRPKRPPKAPTAQPATPPTSSFDDL